MKQRQGFVSNSSSTSFVVCLIPSIDIRARFTTPLREEIINYIAENDDDGDSVEKWINRCVDVLSQLQNGTTIWECHNYAIYRIARDVLANYVISSHDQSSDEGTIMNCYTPKLMALLKDEVAK
jgi:hypothetical protein